MNQEKNFFRASGQHLDRRLSIPILFVHYEFKTCTRISLNLLLKSRAFPSLMRIDHLYSKDVGSNFELQNLKINFKNNETWCFCYLRRLCDRYFGAQGNFRVWSVPYNGFNLFKKSLDTQCTRIGGTCLNWDYYYCTAGWETGLCNGESNIRCCKPCDRACQNLEQSYNDRACTNKGGKCQHNSNKCNGGYQSGLCDGPSDRECCGVSGGNDDPSSCTLIDYSSPRIKGYHGKIRVDEGFKSEMDKMDAFARQCSGFYF